MFNWVDILFIATVLLLAFNGFRNGAVISLINLLTIPLGFIVAYLFGPGFTALLAKNGLPGTPLISYVILFFGTVLVIHIIATIIRGVLHKIPVIGFGDQLLGAVIGFAESWLLWVVLLSVLGSFLNGVQNTLNTVNQTVQVIPGVHIKFNQLQQWHDFYNQAVTHSLFATVNGFIIKALPNLKALVPGH